MRAGLRPHEWRTVHPQRAVEGSLAFDHCGDSGFGYDPIFIPDGHDQTFGQLPIELKHTLSHRARACAALRVRLAARMG